MNTLVAEYLAAEIELLERVVPEPTGPLGWGSDLNCWDDIDETASELAGDDPQTLRQQAYHMLSTPRRQLPGDTEEEENFGIDLLDFVAVGMTEAEVEDAKAMIQNELTKDDRFASVDSEFRFLNSEDVEINISITPAEGDAFDLVLVARGGKELLRATG